MMSFFGRISVKCLMIRLRVPLVFKPYSHTSRQKQWRQHRFQRLTRLKASQWSAISTGKNRKHSQPHTATTPWTDIQGVSSAGGVSCFTILLKKVTHWYWIECHVQKNRILFACSPRPTISWGRILNLWTNCKLIHSPPGDQQKWTQKPFYSPLPFFIHPKIAYGVQKTKLRGIFFDTIKQNSYSDVLKLRNVFNWTNFHLLWTGQN